MAAENTPQCLQSQRENGGHAWNFDGDDPYVICAWCDQMEDAISGRVIREGRPSQEAAEREVETRREIDRLKQELGLADSPETLAAALAAAERMRPGPASGMPRPPAEAREDAGVDREWITIPADGATEEWGVRVDGARIVKVNGPGAREAAEEFAAAYLRSAQSTDRSGEAVAVRRVIGPWEPLTEEGQADER